MMDKLPSNNNLVKAGGGNKVEKPNAEIKSLIYEIRGQQVMLDSDLAKLYQVGTKRINEAVRNNPKKFPERFSFTLSKAESEALRTKFSTANISTKSRSVPRVFTERGIIMLATILKSDAAVDVTIKIVDTFVLMRQYISVKPLSQKYINDIVFRDSKRIDLIEQLLQAIEEKEKITGIYFDGQIYDAYSRILKIFSEAKKSLTIIDAYTDIITLNIIKRWTIPVTIITSKSAPLKSQDIKKYQEQYDNLTIVYNNTFHDRYFILDGKTVYHCGASINRIGYKTFSITKIGDQEIVAALLSKINLK